MTHMELDGALRHQIPYGSSVPFIAANSTVENSNFSKRPGCQIYRPSNERIYSFVSKFAIRYSLYRGAQDTVSYREFAMRYCFVSRYTSTVLCRLYRTVASPIPFPHGSEKNLRGNARSAKSTLRAKYRDAQLAKNKQKN